MKKLYLIIAALAVGLVMIAGCVPLDEYDSLDSETSWGMGVETSDSSQTTDSEQSTDKHPIEIPKDGDWVDLNAAEITREMGLGWNLGNQLEASINGIPNETAWGNPVITEDLIKAVKKAGFSTVRIPVSYLLKIGSAPDYTIDKAWLDRVQEVVDCVVKNDMYAVINLHGDAYYTVQNSWLLCVNGNQDEIKAKYRAVWTQIAERFKDYDEHLIFESMNEVFDNTYGNPNSTGYENINAYNRIFVDTVRGSGGNNAKRWLLIPGWNTNIGYTTEEYGFKIPDDTGCTAGGKRLMISVHYYDPYNFTLDENMGTTKTQWGKYATENFDNWGQEDYVDEQMKHLNERFVSRGYPVVIGELGVQDKSHVSGTFGEYRRYWYEYIVKSAHENGCVPVCWDNGWNGEKGFAFFDRSTVKVTQPEIIKAMVRAMNSGDYEIAPPKV
ncbi:MAG: glycoside hydrolase family 5 protein [Oscillospiraceae bacterium]